MHQVSRDSHGWTADMPPAQSRPFARAKRRNPPRFPLPSMLAMHARVRAAGGPTESTPDLPGSDRPPPRSQPLAGLLGPRIRSTAGYKLARSARTGSHRFVQAEIHAYYL